MYVCIGYFDSVQSSTVYRSTIVIYIYIYIDLQKPSKSASTCFLADAHLLDAKPLPEFFAILSSTAEQVNPAGTAPVSGEV